ncbi:ParB/RepB/Spo0J family partition protein [Streptomyces sp. NPDC090499]|uniref:ParB/RepB/Spo0J family partition protein n=1 Tax=Streptomyces sp. NPDC090499 TaxID=3365965 RepID=UPI003813905E
MPGIGEPLLLNLPLDRLHCTRFNPRRNFGTDDELREFGEKLKKEQLQPAVVVSRAAYLKLWPAEADNVGACPYVIVNGERRYRASQLVDRGVLEVVHREDVAASRASFLDAVQSENNDRQNLDPIERAIAIETMVTELGGADQVAVYYDKTKGWVSQQRKLLKLTAELQDLVSSGDMPVRVARDIAGLPAEVQSAAWDEELAKRKAAKEAAERWKTAGTQESAPQPALVSRPAAVPVERFTAVNQPDPAPASSVPVQDPVPERFTAVNQTAAPPATATAPATPAAPVPEPREPAAPEESADQAETIVGRKFPYDDGRAAAGFLIERMPADQFRQMMKYLMDYHATKQSAG